MNKQQIMTALAPVIPCDTIRRKLVTRGYLSLSSVARGSLAPRTDIEDALKTAGYGPQAINRLITRGIY